MTITITYEKEDESTYSVKIDGLFGKSFSGKLVLNNKNQGLVAGDIKTLLTKKRDDNSGLLFRTSDGIFVLPTLPLNIENGEIGNVDDIVMDIAKDTPLVKLVKEKIKPKRRIKAWEIVLLAVGFPIWLPLAIVALVLIFVFILLVWVMVIVTYSIEIAFAGSSIAGAITFAAYFMHGELNWTALGASVMCAGAAFLFVFAFALSGR